jgi:hypothetical protein
MALGLATAFRKAGETGNGAFVLGRLLAPTTTACKSLFQGGETQS